MVIFNSYVKLPEATSGELPQASIPKPRTSWTCAAEVLRGGQRMFFRSFLDIYGHLNVGGYIFGFFMRYLVTTSFLRR